MEEKAVERASLHRRVKTMLNIFHKLQEGYKRCKLFKIIANPFAFKKLHLKWKCWKKKKLQTPDLDPAIPKTNQNFDTVPEGMEVNVCWIA